MKAEEFDHMVEYYDLAIKFVPGSNAELRATLLSNRSMAHIRRKGYKKAMKDANECISTRKGWFRVSQFIDRLYNTEVKSIVKQEEY